jgi:uncharacterized protein
MKKWIGILIGCFWMLGVTSLMGQSFEIPEKPTGKNKYVYDEAKVFSSVERQLLTEKLGSYEQVTSTQISVASIASTQGENINYLATNWAHKWGIGQKDKDNGVFILLAVNDRKMTIATGYGVEHLLTDFMSKRIIEREIVPEFKKGSYYAGVVRGVDAIEKVLKGEYKASPANNKKGGGYGWLVFVLIVIVFFFLASRGGGGRGGRYRDTGGSIFDMIILSNMGRGSSGGFGGSDFGGGGFSGGFGGGGFGGGGASGSW